MKRSQILKYQAAGYDLEWLSKVQTQGNFKAHGRYLEMGDGYVTCLRVYKYPPRGLGDFWAVNLTDQASTMAVMSIGTEDRKAILEALSRSASEKSSQVSGKAKMLDNITASGTYQSQLKLMSQITQANEVMKRLYIRVFVYAPTIDELEKRVHEVIHNNEKFSLTRFYEEQQAEFQSIFIPTMGEEDLINHPKGTPVSAASLSGSYPFNHVKLEDPNGSYYGYTRTSGQVMFDPFQRDSKRTRSFFFVTGNAGMGKSTLLKKLNDDVFSRGAFIRNFDVSGEYTDQTRDQSGVIIPVGRSDQMINPFEVFATVVNDDGSVDEYNSFANHREKLKNFFHFLAPEATGDDLTLLDSWLSDFYIDNNLWIRNAQQSELDIKITGYPHDVYPTLQDFVVYANQRKRQAERDPYVVPTPDMNTSMNRITTTFRNLLETKGDMFDGITKFQDISNEQVVTFNIRALWEQGQAIFNAEIYLILSLLSAEISKNGREVARKLKAGQIDDIRWYYLNIDEVENLITPKFTYGVEFLAAMMEQMRKNNCAITMAAPTIKDLIMTGSSQDPYILAVQKIFSLFQVRFFFQISDDDLPRLEVALGGSTTRDELQGLTKLERTECLMNINGDRNVQFKVEITKNERMRYGGGM